MLNNERYLGMETNFITENDVETCIREQTPISAKVVEYDITTGAFTVKICEGRKGVLYIKGLKQNTAASYVGRIVNVLILSEDETGVCICKVLRCEDSEAVLKQYKQNTRLVCRVNAILGYGVILEDVKTGAYALLHNSEIQKKFDIGHASEVFSLGQILDEVYINSTEDGVQFSLFAKETEVKETKRYSFLGFLKDKIAS